MPKIPSKPWRSPYSHRLVSWRRPTRSNRLKRHTKAWGVRVSGLYSPQWFSVSVFNLAAQQGAFNPEAKNPFFHAAIPKTPQHRSKPTRPATLDQLLDMIDALDEPAATVVALAAFSGLRKSEIQGLRWEDLKGEELHVQRTAWRPTHVVEQTKTKASRGAVP
jgi:integrase